MKINGKKKEGKGKPRNKGIERKERKEIIKEKSKITEKKGRTRRDRKKKRERRTGKKENRFSIFNFETFFWEKNFGDPEGEGVQTER